MQNSFLIICHTSEVFEATVNELSDWGVDYLVMGRAQMIRVYEASFVAIKLFFKARKLNLDQVEFAHVLNKEEVGSC